MLCRPSGTRAFSGLSGGLQIVFVCQVIQCRAGHSQQPGSLGHVVLSRLQGPDNGFTFRFFAYLPEVENMVVTVDNPFQFQILGGNPSVFRHDGGPLNLVDEFTDVTWPFILLDGANRIIAEANDAPVHLLGEGFQQGLCDDQGVACTLSKWRNVQGDLTDPVIQVFPEAAFLDQGGEIPVCGTDHPDIHRDFPNPTNPFDHAFL